MKTKQNNTKTEDNNAQQRTTTHNNPQQSTAIHNNH